MNEKRIKISPSILSADFSRLGDEVQALCDAGADYIHVDVMDGRFVPNITIGPQVVESIKRCSGNVPLDVHLMIVEPARYVRDFVNAGADILTVHVECEGKHGCDEALAAMSDMISKSEVRPGSELKRGISLSPRTPASAVDRFFGCADSTNPADHLSCVDLVLIMTVEPGFGGQGFMADQLQKIRHVASRAAEAGRTDLLIAVDGGINDQTAKLCVEARANMLVAGSYVFGSKHIEKKSGMNLYKEQISALRQ